MHAGAEPAAGQGAGLPPQPGTRHRGGAGRGDNFRGRGGSQQMPYRSGPPPGSGSGGIFLQDRPVPPPSQKITDAENVLIPATKGRMFPMGAAEVPGRRGYGSKGTAITLRTNYFSVETTFEAGRPEQPQKDAPPLRA